MNLTFHGFERAKVALGPATPVGGRLQAELALTGSTVAGAVAAPPVKFQLLGTADVAGLAPSSIGTMMPPPGAAEADTTKCVYVELTPADLPWRYTPYPREGVGVRPWLVLVVGSPAEVVAEPDGTVSLAGTLTQDYDLARSTRWAHVQDDGLRPIARVLSDRQLKPTADHVAALVGAFRENGDDAWRPGETARPSCYALWRFRTGTAEDFYDLAKAIEAAMPDESLGSAAVTYAPTGSALEVRGALARTGMTDSPLPRQVSSDLASRRWLQGADARGRSLVGLPRYGGAWGAPDAAEPAGGWRGAANGDPRHRTVAGIGAWCGLLEQERIAAAMRERLGAVAVAGQRVSGLALGLAAAGSLWRRRLPDGREARVLLFGPALERVVNGGRTALELTTGPDRPLPAALFTSAAKRFLRGGTARARLARPSARDPRVVFVVTNTCPQPRPPGGIPGLPDTFALAKFRQEVGENPEAGPVDHGLGAGSFSGEVPEGIDRGSLEQLGPGLLAGGREERCRPVPLDVLVDRLEPAFDPTGANALAPGRVLGTIEGLADPPLAPPEACPDIGLPAWAILRDRAKEWLLPGAESLGQNELTAVETNGAFVDAFLLGLNLQALEEARWRNLPVTTGCTPMRRFWELLQGYGSPVDDIRGVASWTEASALGDATHRPPEAPPSRLVIVVRTALFRRYPNTLIYLYPANAGFPRPTIDPAKRVLPIFQGEIERELPFFAFPRTPAEGRTDWLVIEQVPAGYEFWERDPNNDALPKVAANVLDGGEFAAKAFAQPIRVLIKGSEIIPGGV